MSFIRRILTKRGIAPRPIRSNTLLASSVRSCPSACLFHGSSFLSALPPHYPPSVPSSKPVKGMLTVAELKSRVADGKIENIVVGFPDMYGRFMGKRFDAEFFVNDALTNGTHACDYLLASDMEMEPIQGFKFANWERGYGDFHLVPDINSLRQVSWQPKTALVVCDVKHNTTHDYIHVAPRSILRKQIERASKLGDYNVLAASELEYYMYENSFRDANKSGYTQASMKPVSDYVEDYHTLQTAREEKYNAVFRHHLRESGVPVENSKGEAGIGQGELNVRYSDVLQMADRHLVYKQCLKEVSDQLGASITFMAKPYSTATGSGCHIHLSLNSPDGKNAFQGDQKLGPVKCSNLFKYFLGGWLKYTPDVMVFYAPTINSYKRFQSASWAPTRLAWSYDNRTAGYRVVGSGQSLRIECRIPGADAHPYLAFAASLASGLSGVENKIEPPPLFEGDIYAAKQLPHVPKTLRDAVDIFEKSAFAKASFGADVVEHYTHFYRAEQAAFDKHVTDWERTRYFERI